MKVYCSNCNKKVTIIKKISKLQKQTIYRYVCAICDKVLDHRFEYEQRR